MPHKRLKPEYNFNEDQLRSLKQIVPEVFADGKINWKTLKEALGEYLEDDSPDAEHFGLFWPGKRQARRLAGIPSKGTLVPVYGEGLKADGTPDEDGINDSHNIFIEGENLEVLKILQKSYAGRIKMIYIDPPYNTGNDFIYEDDFTEPLQEYLRRTGQVDEEGRPLTTNTRADGRFHSKWLSMMYPRLRLASNLLRDDGVIFVSIDDNEMSHLRAIMNEIFGEENFVANIIWQSKTGSNDAKTIDTTTEYIMVYAKDILTVKFNENNAGYNISRYRYKDEFFETRGPYYLDTLDRGGLRYSDKLNYGIECPDKSIVFPNGRKKFVNDGWTYKWGSEKVKWGIENKFIEIKKQRNGDCEWKVYYKVYLNCDNEGIIIDRGSTYKNLITEIKTGRGTLELNDLFSFNPFKYSKPYELVQEFLSILDTKNDLILDFYAGSGTTAQAVIELNKEDNGTRKYILVQMPEPCDETSEAYKAGFHNIAEIAKERIRRVIKKLNNESNNDKKSKQHKIDFKENSNAFIQDYGFKVFKLQESSYKIWNNYQGADTKELEELFDNSQSPLVNNWRPEKLLAEILLIEGFPLDSKLEQVTGIKKNKVTRVTCDFHEHSLLVCLDSGIAGDTIKHLNLTGDDIFICLDNAVTDQDKVRLADKGMIKTI